MKRALLAVVAATFLLGACGDDGDSGGSGGDSGADAAAVDKIKTSLLAEDDGFALSDGDADCIAKEIAGAFGSERVDEIDFDAETPSFTDDEAATAADAFASCTDLSELFAASLTSDGDVSEDSQKCVADKVDDDMIHNLFEVSFSETGELTEDDYLPIDEVLQECLSDEEYEAVS